MQPTTPPSNHSRKDLYLYGASGHCKVIIEILEASGVTVSGIIDDFSTAESLMEIPVMRNLPDHALALIIAVGNNETRKRIAQGISSGFEAAIHPTAVVSPSATIGEGTVVMAGSIINANAKIGRHCIVNSGAIVEHDADIADFVHISPGVCLAGNVTIGEGAHVGIGASVIQGIKIGEWATIGAGATIIKPIPEFAVVVGNPGKIIKFNHAG